MRWSPKLINAALVVAAACASSTPAQTERTPPPRWFEHPPEGIDVLYFVGDTTGASDEESARDLAIQKALHNLSVYVGATVTSNFGGTLREQDGKTEQVVELTVDVAGERFEIRQASLRQIKVAPSPDGFDAYALVEWPKTQYEAVLETKRRRAQRALELYLEAEEHAQAYRDREATALLTQTETALGPAGTSVPIEHDRLTNTALLRDAVQALRRRLTDRHDAQKELCAVGVVCTRDGKTIPCDAGRAGAMTEAISQSGRSVADISIADDTVLTLTTSEQPSKLEGPARAFSCVVATSYDAKTLAVERGVLFIRYGGRAVIFDAIDGRIVDSKEVPSSKVGFPIFDGKKNDAYGRAEKKGFDAVEGDLAGWVKERLGGMQ